ncbi:MAG: thioredoxin family protein [Metamycoplasmataceae bacterium]
MKKIKWNDAQELLNKKKVTYLIFESDWCGDCIMMRPIVEEVREKTKNEKDFQLIIVDADESGLFRKESIYKVRNIPAHIFLQNGEIKEILYEYQPAELLIENIRKLI